MKLFRREPPGPAELFGTAAQREHAAGPGFECWSDPVGEQGSLVALTEVLIEPGAGQDWPGEASTDVLTWVVAGTLTHEDGAGSVAVPERALLHGSADAGGHRDRNAGTGPLRLIRLQVRRDGPPRSGCSPVAPRVLVAGAGMFEVITRRTELEVTGMHLHVVDGGFSVAGTPLRPGDSVRLFTTRTLDGEGVALAWVPLP